MLHLRNVLNTIQLFSSFQSNYFFNLCVLTIITKKYVKTLKLSTNLIKNVYLET